MINHSKENDQNLLEIDTNLKKITATVHLNFQNYYLILFSLLNLTFFLVSLSEFKKTKNSLKIRGILLIITIFTVLFM